MRDRIAQMFCRPLLKRVTTSCKLGPCLSDQDRHRYAGTDRGNDKMGCRTHPHTSAEDSCRWQLIYSHYPSDSYNSQSCDIRNRGHFQRDKPLPMFSTGFPAINLPSRVPLLQEISLFCPCRVLLFRSLRGIAPAYILNYSCN